ncbi:GNAT family N-acetyltransferase [Kineosporia sp. J2-2]|uniref:GNAT family N-acetyltransferase n=1 Tax=Kineosporia corallincola TaxID=2835133 RepID=A0ABS5THQ3_9ACTN|nr:GNAT family N-acetyltransferase [Kineosporia corallincola]MBT0769588.1 GNAT family N-acetyltransferase [Kineosporia corallincola]
MIRELGRPGDLGWVIQAHGEMYAREFGWDSGFETLVAGIVAGYARDRDPTRENAWIAELDGQRTGSVFCMAGDRAGETDTAVLRTLLVDPAARGHGLGGKLIDTCVRFAREAGYARLRLWTTDSLVSARKLYLARGFALMDETPQHLFGVDLVGQTYLLDPLPRPGRPGDSGP